MGYCCSTVENENNEATLDIYQSPSTSPKRRHRTIAQNQIFDGSTNFTGPSPAGHEPVHIEELMMLIRVQSLVRGFLARRRFKVQKIYNEST